jgi:hypothetical protein
MDAVRAGRVYIAERVLEDPLAGPRAQRLAAAIDAPHREVVDDARIRELQRALPWNQLPRRGADAAGFTDRVVFLDRMHWDRQDEVFPGYRFAEVRNGRKEWTTSGVVCHSAVEIQSILGCGFDCAYCPYTTSLTITCDLERFADEVERLFEERPTQTLYKLNNRSDTLCFEPEYGLAPLLVDRFARTDDRVLMLYAKSANVAHLLDLDHRGHTVACFTLTAPSTARLLEPTAPTFEARLDAAAACANAGYPTRFRFSPLVPLRGWRDELSTSVEKMAARVRPELITLWTLSMIDVDELGRIVPLDALDPAVLEASRAAKGRVNGTKGAPFPPELRAEIYEVVASAVAEHSPSTRLALCLEAPEVLGRLAPYLAVHAGRQVCNCGPDCTPAAVAAAPACGDPVERELIALPKVDRGSGQRKTRRRN